MYVCIYMYIHINVYIYICGYTYTLGILNFSSIDAWNLGRSPDAAKRQEELDALAIHEGPMEVSAEQFT